MDLNTVLAAAVAAGSTLLVAWLGHTVAATTLQKAIKTLVTDLQSGVNLANVQKDVQDVETVVTDAKAVLNAPPAK